MKFESLALGESLALLIDNRGKNPPYAASGIPVVSGLSVRREGLDLRDSKLVTTATWKQWMPNPTQQNDVIMTSEAPLGRVALVRTDDPILIAQRVFGMRGLPGVLDSRFLYYALQTQAVQAGLAARATGSTVLGIRQPELRKLLVPAPKFAEQCAIAAVLGALDDKIAANHRSLELIDSLSQAELSAEIKLSSRSVSIADLLVLNYGKALPAARRLPGKVAVYGSGGVTGSHNSALVESPGIVVGRKGTVGAIYWADGPHYPIDTTYFVGVRAMVPAEVLFYILRWVDFAGMNSDSAVPGLNREEAYRVAVNVPDQDVCAALGATFRARFEWAQTIRAETLRLGATRDELLPLLMSGKIRVEDAEATASELL